MAAGPAKWLNLPPLGLARNGIARGGPRGPSPFGLFVATGRILSGVYVSLRNIERRLATISGIADHSTQSSRSGQECEPRMRGACRCVCRYRGPGRRRLHRLRCSSCTRARTRWPSLTRRAARSRVMFRPARTRTSWLSRPMGNSLSQAITAARAHKGETPSPSSTSRPAKSCTASI